MVKIHRSPATVMGDENCNRPLLDTFTLVDRWEGTAIRLTPEPGDLSVYEYEIASSWRKRVIFFIFRILNNYLEGEQLLDGNKITFNSSRRKLQ